MSLVYDFSYTENISSFGFARGQMSDSTDAMDLIPEEAKCLMDIRELIGTLHADNISLIIASMIHLRCFDSVDRLSATVALIVDKALSGPDFAKSCARLCFHLAGMESTDSSGQPVRFGSSVLRLMQTYWEEAHKDFQVLEASAHFNRGSSSLQKSLEGAHSRCLAITQFLSQLHVNGLLTDNVVISLLHKLLPVELENVSEGNIHCMCVMLETCGPRVKEQESLDVFISQMQKMIDAQVISARICFKMEDIIIRMPVIPASGNAWRSRRKKNENLDENEKTLLDIRALLNKLIPSNYAKLIEDMKRMPFNETADRLGSTVGLIFDKALEEPNYAEFYAMMCRDLIHVEAKDFSGQPLKFRTLVLRQTQNYFEKTKKEENEAEEDSSEEDPEALQRKRERVKRHYLGNIRFISELYKVEMLTDRAILSCLQQLLPKSKTFEDVDEDRVECLCVLLQTSAAKIKYQECVDVFFKQLQKMIDSDVTSLRIRSLMKETIDLKNNGYVSHKPTAAKPTFIKETHAVKHEAKPRGRMGKQRSHKEVGTGTGVQSTATSARLQCDKLDEETVTELARVMLTRATNTEGEENQEVASDSVKTIRRWPDPLMALFIKTVLENSFDVKPGIREKHVEFLSSMAKEGLFSEAVLANGVGQIVESTDDLSVDVPEMYAYSADLIGPLAADNHLSLAALDGLLSRSPNHLPKYRAAFRKWSDAHLSLHQKEELINREPVIGRIYLR